MNENLFTVLRRSFPADLSRPFLIEPGGRSLSYGDVLELSGRLASALLAMGIEPGDRIAVQTEKSSASLLLYLAALRVGAVYLPLNPAYTGSEVLYFLKDAEPALLVCRPQSASHAQAWAHEAEVALLQTLGVDGTGTLIEAMRECSPLLNEVVRSGEDLAAILYTSGTTGQPKGAMLTHGNLASNAVALREVWRLTSTDQVLHALPIFHIHGLFVATHVTLLAGGSLLFLPSFDAREVIRLLPQATVMMGVPTFYTRLLAEDALTREATACTRLFISGSAPLTPETHREFERRTGHRLLERYGMTEAGIIASNPYEERERIAGSVGRPLPGVEIRIADATGQGVADGDTGMIEIRGPNVFKGYWRKPQKTAEAIRENGFFISGDLGQIDPQGYLRIVGRAKDLIISGGLNIYPAEVEQALQEAAPSIAECAVIGVPHPDFGEGVIAVVTVAPGAELRENQIHAALASRLAKYKQPKRVFVIDNIPRNAMGKVQKNLLRERYVDTFGEPG